MERGNGNSARQGLPSYDDYAHAARVIKWLMEDLKIMPQMDIPVLAIKFVKQEQKK
jgi:hypothetical protein